ncbi:MAG: GAF domain-containing protein [Gammaproteobacteria bacterium]
MRKLAVFSLLTLIAVVVGFILPQTYEHYEIPLQTTPSGSYTLLISKVHALPLPAGVQAGDVLDLRRLTPETRAWLMLNNPSPEHAHDLLIQRKAALLTVSVISTRAPQTFSSTILNRVLRMLVLLSILTLGLLTLWRGRNWTAWGLSLLAISVLISDSLYSYPGSPWLGLGLNLLAGLGGPVGFSGLYLTALGLAGSGLHSNLRRSIHGIYAAVLVLSVVLAIAPSTIAVFEGRILFYNNIESSVASLPIALLILIPLAVLILGYRRVDLAQRLRIRWVLWSTVLLVPVLGTNLVQNYLTDPTVIQVTVEFRALFATLAFAGYTYAVLRQRLVDIRIAVNHTLVYSIIVAIVVGIFAAVSAFLEHAALGQNASLFLELSIPLALGIAIHTLRKQVEGWINRFIFRRKYRAEAALNDFARTCDFIEEPQQLLHQTVDNVLHHTGAEVVALYERGMRDYICLYQVGKRELPVQVETDDPALVRLRAGDHEVDLHTLPGALGGEGYVFPLMVRGTLLGVLACGQRPAEQYAADERTLLRHVTHQVAAAWQTLKVRDKEKLVEALASGAIEPSTAREQARQLLLAGQTA